MQLTCIGAVHTNAARQEPRSAFDPCSRQHGETFDQRTGRDLSCIGGPKGHTIVLVTHQTINDLPRPPDIFGSPAQTLVPKGCAAFFLMALLLSGSTGKSG